MRFILSREIRIYNLGMMFSGKKAYLVSFFFLALTFTPFSFIFASETGNVVINEVMWKGSPEWIELYNKSSQDIEIEGWQIAGAKTGGAALEIKDCKNSPCVIKAGSYFLITDKESKLPFDLEESISLKDDKENGDLVLMDENGNQIDLAEGDEWPAGGEEGDEIFSMERINPNILGVNKDNWSDSKKAGGTPKAKNSEYSDKIPDPLSADAGGSIVSQVGKEITFDASASTGKIQEYFWNFGDGRTSEGKVVSHSFEISGKYLISLTVDDGSEKDEDIIEVTIFSSDVFVSEFSPDEKWIEIVNFSDNVQNLSGWEITDEIGEGGFVFPEDSYISSGSFILVSSALLSKISLRKDVLFFLYPTGDIRQEIQFDHSFDGLGDIWSIARKGDGYFYTKTQTKGMPNIISGKDEASVFDDSEVKEGKADSSGIFKEEEKEAEDSSKGGSSELEGEAAGLLGDVQGAQASDPQKKLFDEDVLDKAKARKKDLILAGAGISLFSGFFGFGLVRLRRRLKEGKKDFQGESDPQKELIEVEVVN